MPLAQHIRMCSLIDDVIDPRRGRPLPAGSDHAGDNILDPFEHGLDAAVTPVPHPASQAEAARLMFDPGAVADALPPAADQHPTGHTAHRFAFRNSAARAAT